MGLGMSIWPEEGFDDYNYGVFVANLAHAANEEEEYFGQASFTDTLTYPCQGMTDVAEAMYGEAPDPLSGSGLFPPVGPAIMVNSPWQTDGTTTLRVLTATVSPVARLDGQPLDSGAPVFVMGSAYPFGIFKLNEENIANNLPHPPSETFLMTHQPLLNGVTYRVDLGFTVDGVSQIKSFEFSTRAEVPNN